MADPVEHALELTVSSLKDGVADLGLAGGLIEIQRWEELLDGHEQQALQDLGGQLAELRGELESDMPDEATVGRLLLRLGEETLRIAGLEPDGDVRRALSELGNLLVREAHTTSPGAVEPPA